MKLKSYIRGIGIGILVTVAVFLVSGINSDNKMTDEQVIARAKELGMTEASATVAQAGNLKNENDTIVEDSITEEPEAKTNEPVVSETVTPVAEAKEDIQETTEDEDIKKATEETKKAEEAKEAENSKKAEEQTKELEEAKKAAQEAKKATEEAEKIAEEVNEIEKEDNTTEKPKVTEKVEEATEKPKVTEKVEETATTTDGDSVVIVVNSGEGSDTVARKLYEAGIVADAREFDKFLMANGYDRKITTGNHIIPKNATNDEIGKNLVSSTR